MFKTTSMNENTSQHSANLARFDVSNDGQTCGVQMSGNWQHDKIENVAVEFPLVPNNTAQKRVIIDMSGVTNFDTAGAWLLHQFTNACDDKGIAHEVSGASDKNLSLLSKIPAKLPDPNSGDNGQKSNILERLIERTAKGWRALYSDIIMGLNILGATIQGGQLKEGRKTGASPAAIVTQMDHIGVRAVPIVVLMSLAIGAIITQQSAFQLRAFGAEVFAADLVSVLQLREVGVLITSIMIAGRSGSAITAEIGSMKMREEVDALKVMGLNPVGVLVFPRLIALVIVLPLLTIVANFAALFASALVLYFYSEVPFNVFLSRMKAFIDYTTLTSGMIKTPFMAITIGIIAAVEGLKVGGSAESLGRRVTASVVKAIFLVIVIDGIFAIFYAAIDF
jgi:phospholipid/cholesterol/gamma-HCH transport system permease protein